MKVSWTNRRSIKIGLRFVGALLFAVLLFAISLRQAGREGTTVTQTPSPAGQWQEIDRLVSEQKFEAALQQVEKIRVAAQKSGKGKASRVSKSTSSATVRQAGAPAKTHTTKPRHKTSGT